MLPPESTPEQIKKQYRKVFVCFLFIYLFLFIYKTLPYGKVTNIDDINTIE